MRINDLKENVIKGYNGYLLPDKERSKLLALFPPKYPDIIAHHITEKYPAMSTEDLPSGKSFRVVGYSDDGNGVEAIVVEVNGTIKRPDGKIYHITMSIDRSKGYKPVDSNTIIANQGFQNVQPINISMEPKFFKG
jgi:hypothetical protein